eukprot:TRINITY_DN1449_c0_g1_i1.p1 TRINITY_DN1449_c0_g1~~TRINITY_DN1449_c0_g1_i1.p1  ORF type:complete len:670 (+),score=220.97 TRINITY_DN1449_c0_g1_i1:170-2179(+)
MAVTEEDENQMRKRMNTPRSARVKNRSAAPIQITAEQLLKEAQQYQETEIKPPKQRITDPDELEDYRFRKRKQFEDLIRRNRGNMTNWLKYASWEESQTAFARARSVFERAIDVDYRSVILWLKYAEMEMKNKNVNAARNVWDRAVAYLPRVDQLWLKYSYMEDIMGNYPGARQIFERWMSWEPNESAWQTYIRFEMRCGEIERARALHERMVQVHPTVSAWLKRARFESKFGSVDSTRSVYQDAIEILAEEANDEKLFISFAKFEERCKETERARAIYKYALDHIPKKEAQELYKTWISFEKKNGDREGIEDVIIGKRRFQYEEELKKAPQNYDTWFDYCRLEETYSEPERVREIYERAIANLPPSEEKRYWRRYIYLWINYALYEELEAKDFDRTRAIFKECIARVPHKKFTFAKIWNMYAHFEIRRKNLKEARLVYGHAIGAAPRDSIFKAYIQLELQIGEVQRCRQIYERWLEVNPYKCDAWVGFAQLENDLGNLERARAIYDLAVQQDQLDFPEILWKSFIDFEIELEEYDRAKDLYVALLERTQHVKVYISFAQFEASIGKIEDARKIYSDAYDHLKENKPERVILVESWRDWEKENGDETAIANVEKKIPRKVIKTRPIQNEDGTEAGREEYYEYIFPGEDVLPSMKILEKAKAWKKANAEA